MNRYIALLRGINVGGKNVIPMAKLREAFHDMGFSDVATLIQSGNVVLSSQSANGKKVAKTIEDGLEKRFAYEARIVLLSAQELQAVVDEAPKGFGRSPMRYRYDVLFLRPPLTAREAIEQVPRNPDVDEVQHGTHALYFRRLIANVTKSRLSRVTQLPIYKSMTIRNWPTTLKLRALAAG